MPKVLDWDPSRHTAWSDITASDEGIVISLKWTKTRQHNPHPAAIPMPALDNSILCPLRAWSEYVDLLGGLGLGRDVPLLLSTAAPKGQPISAPQFRATFHRVALLAGLGKANHTPHSLRRGGATFSYEAGVLIPFIKRHGTWTSSAVEGYLLGRPFFDTPVARTFGKLLKNYHG